MSSFVILALVSNLNKNLKEYLMQVKPIEATPQLSAEESKRIIKDLKPPTEEQIEVLKKKRELLNNDKNEKPEFMRLTINRNL